MNVGHDDEKKSFKTPKYTEKPNSKYKSKEYVESDDSSSSVSGISDDSDDSDTGVKEKTQAKKKQKPKPKSIKSDNAAGFSDVEVRR